MDFNLDLSKILYIDSEGYSIFQSDFFQKLNQKNQKIINEIIDIIGDLSSEVTLNLIKSQGLKVNITTGSKFFSSDHKLYLKIVDNSVIGLLKVGPKTLYINDTFGKYHKISPLCVLDFYIHHSQQRNGFGKELFEKMLRVENISPHKIAYDRPSQKLISFLRKHYSLEKYVPQNNNFIVFNDYFQETGPNIKNKIVNSERKNIDNFPIKKNYISEVKEEESKTVNKNNTNKTIQNLNFSPLLENNKKINEHNYPKHSNIQSGRNENKKFFNDDIDDGLDNLNSKFQNMKINKTVENDNKSSNSTTINKNMIGHKSTKNCPWAVDNSANSIPTSSSSLYGAYYYNK